MADERIYLNLDQVEALERDINVRRHIERYALARQFLFGRVLDAACGVGYGTYLCQKNPDVIDITGIDIDADSINWANEHFVTPKTRFVHTALNEFNDENIDCLMTLETIEHLKRPSELVDLANRCKVHDIVLSFPLKKTTHYNPFHLWDFAAQDILDLFDGYSEVARVDQARDYLVMHLVRRRPRAYPPKRLPSYD